MTFVEDVKHGDQDTRTEATDRAARILIVDDNPDHALLAQEALRKIRPWTTDVAHTVEGAFPMITSETYDLVLVDYRLPDGDGLDLIGWAVKKCPVVVMTGAGNEKIAVDALQRGAYDYVVKDSLFYEMLPEIVQRAIDKYHIDGEVGRLRTQLERENKKLAEANRRLRTIDALKSDFLASASDQLKAPLAIVRDFVAILKDGNMGDISAGQKACLESALNNCDRLGYLIDSTLGLQEIESGRTRLRRRKSDLPMMIGHCYRSFTRVFQAHEQKMRIDLDDNLPSVLCDSNRITEVLKSLIDRARHSAPVGGIVIIRAFEEEGVIVVEIEDNGPVISGLQVERALDSFSVTRTSADMERQSTVLELSIARSIVQHHNGSVRVASGDDIGNTVSFTLPIYEEMAEVRSFIGDRQSVADINGDRLCLSLLRLDEGSDTVSPDRSGVSVVAGLQRFGEEVHRLFRDGDDEVLAMTKEDTLVILTSTDEAGAQRVIDRLVRLAVRELGLEFALSSATVAVSSGNGVDDWYRHASNLLAPIDIGSTEEPEPSQDEDVLTESTI